MVLSEKSVVLWPLVTVQMHYCTMISALQEKEKTGVLYLKSLYFLCSLATIWIKSKVGLCLATSGHCGTTRVLAVPRGPSM